MTASISLFFLFFCFASFSASAQLPEKAEDISPLLIGENIPEATVKAPDGNELKVLELFSKKPTVLLFYRGGWCPYCNTHLAEIQEAETRILELGYQIIGISPDSPDNLKATDEKNKLNYSLYSDGDGSLTKAMGIAFKAPERSAARLFDYSGGMNEGYLPVPSVFVVDTSGQIAFEYINPDYKTRISADLLLAVLEQLKIEQK
jgi:peroxiredoxin